MSIFTINISTLIDRVTPPKKRGTNLLALAVGLLSAWNRVYNTFTAYKIGSISPNWSAGTYDIYYQVIYERRVYESLESGNTATPHRRSAAPRTPCGRLPARRQARRVRRRQNRRAGRE